MYLCVLLFVFENIYETGQMHQQQVVKRTRFSMFSNNHILDSNGTVGLVVVEPLGYGAQKRSL